MLYDRLPLKKSKNITMILTEGENSNQIKKNWKEIEKILRKL